MVKIKFFLTWLTCLSCLAVNMLKDKLCVNSSVWNLLFPTLTNMGGAFHIWSKVSICNVSLQRYVMQLITYIFVDFMNTMGNQRCLSYKSTYCSNTHWALHACESSHYKNKSAYAMQINDSLCSVELDWL